MNGTTLFQDLYKSLVNDGQIVVDNINTYNLFSPLKQRGMVAIDKIGDIWVIKAVKEKLPGNFNNLGATLRAMARSRKGYANVD